MLSRFVVSQVKHNSYFLAGLALGLWLALMCVPLDEAPVACARGPVVQSDEFAPQHVERGAGAGAGRAVSRPRYYTTELGMRAPLLAAVLSSEPALAEGGVGAALNATCAALGGALRFFISASSATPGAARANVVGFTDTREMLRPFHAIKYLADNHLDDYDFFFLASDATFVNARQLRRLVSQLSVSRDVYMGAVAEDDSHYCTLEGGILLSNSVLRAVHNELDWCVRNSYSAHHHENIGRCVLHAAHLQCSGTLQAVHYTAVRDEGGASSPPPPALPHAVTVSPITDPRRFHQLHAYVSRVYLESGEREVTSLRRALRASSRRHPPGYRNASWPRGLRDDPGLAPPTPDSRWDHLRWTAFNATHVLMPDDHHSVSVLSGPAAAGVRLAGEAAIAWALRRWGAGHVELVEGAWRWEPATALRYHLLLSVRGPGPPLLRQVEVARALGAARLVPVPYVTESARVWLVLAARAGDPAPAEAFLKRYEAACLQRRANTALVTVVVRGLNDTEQVGSAIMEAARALAGRYRSAQLEVLEARADKGGAGEGRTALDAALRVVPRDALVLLSHPHMDFNEDFLNRVRMNSIPGEQWYLPVAFARFEQYSHPRFVDANGGKPQTNTGRFNPSHADVVGVYRRDYEAAVGTAGGGAGRSVAALLAGAALRCVRAPEPGLVVAARGAPCGLRRGGGGGDTECLRATRDAHFTGLDLGARHTLAKLLLEIQAERGMA